MNTSTIKNKLSPDLRRNLRKLRRRMSYLKESILGGGELRESVLLGLLGRHYASLYRRLWLLSDEEPHFSGHRVSVFTFAFGKTLLGPESFYRGFYSSEVIRGNDRVLDIGCGDGFFTGRFFSARCRHVDAIDNEPDAINEAVGHNSAPNISYHLLDAVSAPFPGDQYEVIVWDGALGHFATDTTNEMLEKISRHLTQDGIFVGSESLGLEGSDHLQFFESLDDLYLLFKPHFKHIELRSVDYRINVGVPGESLRREGFWRCSNDRNRLRDSHWQLYPDTSEGPQPASERILTS